MKAVGAFTFRERWTLAGLSVGLVCLIVLTRLTTVADFDRSGEMGVGGNAPFEAVAALVALLPEVASAVTLAALVSFGWPRLRAEALRSLVVLGGSNLTVWALKAFLGVMMGEVRATLPSGHATLALSSASAIVFLANVRKAWLLPCAGFLGTLGTFGVVAARWHLPGDALAACAVVVFWLVLADCIRPVGRHSARVAVPGLRRGLRDLAVGAAIFPIMLIGWGFAIQGDALTRLAGMLSFLVLTPAAAGVLALAARVGQEPIDPTH